MRRAGPADVPPLARMLGRAFLDDPVACWAIKSQRARPRALESFQGARVRQLLGEQEVWTAEDHSSAALWAPPSRWRTTLRQDAALARCLLSPRLVHRLPLVTLSLLGLERRHPPQPPHYYLAVLGTDPDHQGRGLGSALLAPVLQQCDRDGVAGFLESSKEEEHNRQGGIGAFLECSKESNISFYERHGFYVIEEIHLLRGPPMWQMWRDPPGRPRTF